MSAKYDRSSCQNENIGFAKGMKIAMEDLETEQNFIITVHESIEVIGLERFLQDEV